MATLTIDDSLASALADDYELVSDYPEIAQALKAAGFKGADEAAQDAEARERYLAKSTAGRKVLHIFNSHVEQHGAPTSGGSALYKSLYAYLTGASEGSYTHKSGSVEFPG